MPSHDLQKLVQTIKESADDFDLTNRFKSSEPCIDKGHKAPISKTKSEIISYDQAVNDYITKQLSHPKTHVVVDDLMEFGMAANHVTTNELICGLKHNILIVDDEYEIMRNDHISEHKKPFPINVVPFYPRNYVSKQCMELVDEILFQENKLPKVNHPHGWYRKFEKKRF